LTDKATRLYPVPPHELPAKSIHADLELPPENRRDGSRPYVIINMVSSLDGRIAVEGKSGLLGSPIDRQVMRNLRARADAVMIGANTLRAEKLSLGLDEPSTEPQPIAIIATTSGDVPLESNLILGERQEVLLMVPEDLAVPSGERRLLRVPADRSGNIDLREALRILKSEHRVDLLLVEGGPTVNHALISHNLVDELFLTIVPKLLGGTLNEGLAILHGPVLAAADVRLLSAHLAEDELFLRYSLR
jgi:riboflavin-specific deaminase-like protein